MWLAWEELCLLRPQQGCFRGALSGFLSVCWISLSQHSCFVYSHTFGVWDRKPLCMQSVVFYYFVLLPGALSNNIKLKMQCVCWTIINNQFGQTTTNPMEDVAIVLNIDQNSMFRIIWQKPIEAIMILTENFKNTSLLNMDLNPNKQYCFCSTLIRMQRCSTSINVKLCSTFRKTRHWQQI